MKIKWWKNMHVCLGAFVYAWVHVRVHGCMRVHYCFGAWEFAAWGSCMLVHEGVCWCWVLRLSRRSSCTASCTKSPPVVNVTKTSNELHLYCRLCSVDFNTTSRTYSPLSGPDWGHQLTAGDQQSPLAVRPRGSAFRSHEQRHGSAAADVAWQCSS